MQESEWKTVYARKWKQESERKKVYARKIMQEMQESEFKKFKKVNERKWIKRNEC